MTETTFKSKKLTETTFKPEKKGSDTRTLTIEVEPELYRELEQQAERINTSLNDYIKKVLTDSLAQSKLK
ncbi:MAG: toxin-antitoxin system HicB family antitoxin [Ignavibacteriales bacterium]